MGVLKTALKDHFIGYYINCSYLHDASRGFFLDAATHLFVSAASYAATLCGGSQNPQMLCFCCSDVQDAYILVITVRSSVEHSYKAQNAT